MQQARRPGLHEVTATALNVRSSPAVAPDNRIGRVEKGELIDVTASEGGWMSFAFEDEQEAWASSRYLAPVEGPAAAPEQAPAAQPEVAPAQPEEDDASWWSQAASTASEAVGAARERVNGAVDAASAAAAGAVGAVTGAAQGVWDGAVALFERAMGPEDAAPTQDAAQEVDEVAEAPLEDAPAGTTREQFLAAYEAWLLERAPEVAALEGDARVARVDGLLSQIEQVCARLNQGTLTDVTKLDPTPDGMRAQVEDGFVPPELIQVVRGLVEIVEQGVEGAAESDQAVVEGSRHSNVDWNARLGVPTYRNQLDNLVAGEATCNVTSTSMVLERLGYTRADLIAAIERQMKIEILQEEKKEITDENLASIQIDDESWKSTVEGYLKTINADSANYRKIRGQKTTDAKRLELAGEYQDNAQMEDLLDLLCDLIGVSRYSIVGDPSKVLGAVESDASERPNHETITAWDSKGIDKLRACLDAGGGAILSVRHKGTGNAGTHLVSIQSVTSDGGLVVDDPYGEIRDGYRGDASGDAYADPGKSRSSSELRNERHNDDWEDWKSHRAQDLDADERRGESVTLEKDQVVSMFNRLTLYHRATKKADDA